MFAHFHNIDGGRTYALAEDIIEGYIYVKHEDGKTIFMETFFKGSKKNNIRFIDFGSSRSMLTFIKVSACITI